MNKDLNGNIIARLDKVKKGSKHIITDQFFEELTIVTNALDNVAARDYADFRCELAKILQNVEILDQRDMFRLFCLI